MSLSCGKLILHEWPPMLSFHSTTMASKVFARKVFARNLLDFESSLRHTLREKGQLVKHIVCKYFIINY